MEVVMFRFVTVKRLLCVNGLCVGVDSFKSVKSAVVGNTTTDFQSCEQEQISHCWKNTVHFHHRMTY